ncbi:MAG: 2-C-methyl-D-erythritol 2,4-cyclodiphosphate synthase [Planctomycetota bacterium]|nr:2-C-methyl-D-erythritol 2,4-cyclodiphosphate synthase [Planctomycetota bacterium]
MRIGYGYDSHKLVAGRQLRLGGVDVEYDRGCVGHSDADALVHAVIDAILGAAALGDIGMRFPDTDPKYKDAYSLELLKQISGALRDAGYRIANVDATVIIERPKLGRLKAEMAANIAGALGISPSQVNVKAKTAEGLGPVGSGDAVEAHAVALIEEMRGQ